ncbi:protein ORF13 [Anguillid herpesvirus 1]|uniref:Protein ORF13 n=1 Tax=Anguillid herpesvirus 1 TaxID=150286 RepID=A0A8E5AKU4_9VIRU|nr:protein ORF13 [Anguillid herpesvirus 1]ADA57776.1 protein ORF13 [Anguillid herpesvirus 1]QRM16308.1 protein ORF13 [Anguillid herpesvirus 1]QRM16439.1 protein ORF13 [Anguillid herpesvirus 1]QRM16567.1 protein ORF13 [Anguillid herpesvirus 1]QRM16700.1 protein ORF13 [Anguillid herpesvirus 1]
MTLQNVWTWLDKELDQIPSSDVRSMWRIILLWPHDKHTHIPMSTVKWLPNRPHQQTRLFKYQTFYWRGHKPTVRVPTHCDYEERCMPEIVIVLKNDISRMGLGAVSDQLIDRRLKIYSRCRTMVGPYAFDNDGADDVGHKFPYRRKNRYSTRLAKAELKRRESDEQKCFLYIVPQHTDWPAGPFNYCTRAPVVRCVWPKPNVSESSADLALSHLGTFLPPMIVEQVGSYLCANDVLGELIDTGFLRLDVVHTPLLAQGSSSNTEVTGIMLSA